MTQRKTWLEVALNGSWTRRYQPLIPVSPAEIIAEGIAAARAGAAIVHLHAYDAASGRQRDDPEIYAAIIAGIRAEVDAIVYPTIPHIEPGPDAAERTRLRYAAIDALAERRLLEWTVVDPGSVNLAHYDAIATGREGVVYVNSERDIRAGLDLAQRYRIHPTYAIYEPGFLRLGAALHRRYPEAPQPIYRLMFSEQLAFGLPPERFALAAYRELLRREAPEAPWMVAGLGVDVMPLIADVVAAGGHVRVGLEDAPLGNAIGNGEWVRRAAGAIRAAGGTLATAAEVRAALG
ncbi:MAG TPA: 3-keto-5-aminohexanoate cleavage protein [Stellaceae bacterium]|nr:3-keto-5-aminohexanoate cleavage protein [Stellaceae bacterium]